MKDSPTAKVLVDLSKAKNRVIAMNYQRDPHYTPYCMRCRALERMTLEAPFLWKHHCGAVHDERQVLT